LYNLVDQEGFLLGRRGCIVDQEGILLAGEVVSRMAGDFRALNTYTIPDR
jgi:hypothetical protein